jgi:hypothetical protein
MQKKYLFADPYSVPVGIVALVTLAWHFYK